MARDRFLHYNTERNGHSSSKTGNLSYSSTRSIENLEGAPAEMLSWKQAVAKYQEPMLRKSLWQVINTLIPYLSLSGLMIWTLHVSYWLTLAVAAAAAAFLTRIFIIFHDCGHGSFFRSQHANDLLGFVTGVLTFTPYHQWRHKHALHHATSSDLDGSGTGDILTLTVQEYVDAPRGQRIGHRIILNRFVRLSIAPV